MLIFWSFIAAAQSVMDDFNDGIESDPAWFGDTASFKTMGGSLWSDHQQTYDQFSIATSITPLDEFEISFVNHLYFNTSSVNYVEIGLFNDSLKYNGLVIRLGGQNDNVSFHHVLNNSYRNIYSGIEKTTIDSRLFCRFTYNGGNVSGYIEVGEDKEKVLFSDSSLNTDFKPTYMTFTVKQSTSGFFGKHELEYIYYGEPIRDTIAPKILNWTASSADQMTIQFTEPFVSDKLNVQIALPSGWVGIPPRTSVNPTSIKLHTELRNGQEQKLIITGICDEEENCNDTIVLFTPYYHESVVYGDLIISEIMAKPEPAVGLPAYEYFEIHNRSLKIVDLGEIHVTIGHKQFKLPHSYLLPDSFIAVMDKGSELSNPSDSAKYIFIDDYFSIDNLSELFILTDNEGNVIHEMDYSIDLISDNARSRGGWSVELCDPDRFCTIKGNWNASVSDIGGTPGRENSRQCMIIDNEAPVLRYVGLNEDNTLVLNFNEGIYPGSELILSADTPGFDYKLDVFSFNNVSFEVPDHFLEPLKMTVSGQSDCYGNISYVQDTFLFAISQKPLFGDVIINEVLTDPQLSAEFIELKNISEKAIDVLDLMIRTRTEGGEWSAGNRIKERSHLLFPGQIICFTEEKDKVISHFTERANARNIFQTKDLPVLNNKEAFLGIAGSSLSWIDTPYYSEQMHHVLIADTKDVSFERLPDRTAFSSASTASGYGTPGSENSNSIKVKNAVTEGDFRIRLSNDPFTPNNDGIHDALGIEFSYDGPFTYSMSIFDTEGSLVRKIADQAYAIGQAIHFWDGTGENGLPLHSGIFVVVVQYRTENNKIRRNTKCVTLHY